MNKKFLSAILFGALMVTSTGTFVSCKDYDDEIDNLQGQIDKLASKEDLSSQIATLQSALSSAASNASDALAKATAAETAAKAAGDAAAEAKAAADKAAAEAETNAIAAVQTKLDSVKAELEEAIANGVAENKEVLEEMVAKVEETKKEVEEIVGEIADMVTSVSLVLSEYEDSYLSFNNNPALTWGGIVFLSSSIEKANIFEEGIANAIEFEAGKERQTPNSLLVRVSPTNAELLPEMISFVNSKGENIDDVIKVTKVERANVLLSRAAEKSGLWKVTFEAVKYGDGKAFTAATTTKVGDATKNVLFAVQVNNTLSSAETRYVTSTYDVKFGYTPYKPVTELNFTVGGIDVVNFNNRFKNEGNNPSLKETAAKITYVEQTWMSEKDVAEGYSVPAIEGVKDKNMKAATEDADNRSEKPCYPAVQGQAFKIALFEGYDDKGNAIAPSHIRAMYVTLDKDNAVESAPSELNAWKGYTITNLDKVVDGTSIELTINNTTAINDIIGFRVYAVNYDGTLVDPDGKAFYVNLGTEAANWNAKATTITPTSETITGAKSEAVATTLTAISGVDATKSTWTTDKIGESEDPVFNAVFVMADESEISTATLADFEDVDFTKVAKVYTVPTLNAWTSYEDDKAYNGTLTLKNATGHVLATIKVSMTKVLPKTFPATFQPKVNQLNAAGTLNAFMLPIEKGAKGQKDLTQSFNGLKDEKGNIIEGFEFTFAKVTQNTDGTWNTVTVKSGSEYVFEVPQAVIDNKAEHAVTAAYNYGQISSKMNADKTAYVDHKVTSTIWKNIIFSCLAEINKYAWSVTPSLTYAQEDGKTLLQFINVTNERDGKYTTTLDKLGTADKDMMVVVDESATFELWSQSAKDGDIVAGSKNEYFTPSYSNSQSITLGTGDKAVTYTGAGIVFEPNSEAQNPEATVYSTLIIKAKDYFGHETVITIKNVEVKKR